MGQNIEREAKDNIRREVTAYPGANVAFYRTDKGDAVRAVIQYRGRSREVRFWRMSSQAHAMRSIISDTRRQMRDLGIIDRDKGRHPIRHVGVIGDKLIAAVKKAAPESFAPPAPEPDTEPVIDIDVGSADQENDERDLYVVIDDFLCPDAIAERNRATRQETRPMKTTSDSASAEPIPQSNGANGHAAVTKNKLTKQEVVALTKLLLRVGATDEKTGLYAYQEGWGDEQVHKALGTKANLSVVSDTRKDYFGKLASEMKAAKLTDAARIELLEARVSELEKQLRILIG